MKFKTACRSLLLFAAALVLSACGGGGSAGDDGSFLSPGMNVTTTATATTVQAGRSIDITLRATQGNGFPAIDGTLVRATVSPASAGTLIALQAGGSPTGPGAGSPLTTTTVGGVATFRFTAATPGTATLVFSVGDPVNQSTMITSNVVVTVTPGVERLQITPTRDTLPINAFNVSPFLGSPYMAEVTISVRDSTGQSVNLPDGIQVSVNPVGNTGGFSTLDDATTQDINEFTVRLGQGPVDVVAGQATVFLHSLNFSGTTTMTVTFQDPVTQEVTTATRTFTIVSTSPPLPNTVVLNRVSTGAQYIQGSGGNTTGQFEIQVRDGIGQPVPDPVAGNTSFNNVRIEIVDAANTGGARVTGVNAAGQNVSGSSINVRTTQGITGFVLVSGDRLGTFVVRAISDRADNNVDNGIQDPVVAQRSVAISDGVLFDLEMAVPTVNALQINPVSTGTTPPTGTAIPPSPDASYSLTVAIVATDRLGNPVLPGTPISFGLIDEPQALGIGDFLIAGNDGDPQEGGTLFTAPSGRFTTAGGGAGPGDGLVVFGEESIGNRDLESARVIARINGPTSLNVQRRFNLNDDTGVSVNNGPVLPYVIGRAADGNITANAVTNALGVARTQMTYPVNRLGKRAIVWAQGDGAIVGGSPETVTDVELLSFAGVAPATVTASPSTIPANTIQEILVCISDALGAPIQGVQFGFSFNGASGGTTTVDGIPNSGAVQSLTGPDGCTTATVRTSGLLEGAGDTLVTFFAGGASADVEIQFTPLVLTARPSALTGSGDVTLTLLNGNGTPQPGVQIFGECEGEGGATITLAAGPGITDANGRTTATISAFNLDQVGSSGSGSCEFFTADRSTTATVTLQGRDVCELNFSPPPQGCPVTNFTLTVVITGGSGTVVSAPNGINCTRPVGAAGNQTCTASYQEGTGVVLVATNTSNGDTAQPTFSGECAEVARTAGSASTAETANASVSMNGARTCNVVFAP